MTIHPDILFFEACQDYSKGILNFPVSYHKIKNTKLVINDLINAMVLILFSLGLVSRFLFYFNGLWVLACRFHNLSITMYTGVISLLGRAVWTKTIIWHRSQPSFALSCWILITEATAFWKTELGPLMVFQSVCISHATINWKIGS